MNILQINPYDIISKILTGALLPWCHLLIPSILKDFHNYISLENLLKQIY